MRAYEWVLVHWPSSWRRRIAIVVALVVFVLAALPLLVRIGGVAVDLGFLPYVALMILCWLGEGGALVPIPGVRLLSWMTIVQQGANLEPVIVAVLAAVAMALGQSTYFLVTRSGGRFVDEHVPPGPLRDHLPIPKPATAGAGTGLAEGGSTDAVGPAPMAEPVVGGDGRRARLARAAASVAHRVAEHPRVTIFAVSVLPSPLTTLTTVTAASSGVPFRVFLTSAFCGFLMLSTVLAVAGQAILTLVDR